ncbi:structural maintenance of chromosomes protein 4 isoform X2 [Orussus abietinus]|nr:structural maintenance of chromosomes protein 4 isoform X2 [Orussus abietinus]
MLFVFGCRSNKFRLKKITGAIHNSNQSSNIKRCKVAVHFQQIVDKAEGGYDVVPNSQFIISRTVYKDNTSYYEYNDKKIQFKEVTKMLRSYGIDLDYNRFLILQGEVEQIAMMKPKGQSEGDIGMLEFLEDIIGTTRYKEPLEKLSQKVETLSEYRIEKLNRLRILEKEKSNLEEPMRSAVEYLKLENEITRLQHQLYHCKRLETSEMLNEQEAKRIDMDKDVNSLIEQMKEVKREKEQLMTEIKDKSKKWDSLVRKKESATENFDKIKRQDEALHAELIETNKRRKATMASVKAEKAKLDDLMKVPTKNVKTIEEYQKLAEKYVADRTKQENALTNLMAGLQTKTAPLLKQRTTLETELITRRKEVDDAKAVYEIARSELNLYTSIEKKEKQKLEVLEQDLKDTEGKFESCKQRSTTLSCKIPATEQSLEKAQKDLDNVRKEEASVSAQLKDTRLIVEEKRAAMNASRSRNRVLDVLMREKREGRIPGIFGRLGDLGAIDSKYDVAVSTACGPLDNIVVDKVTTAEACITFLRQNDIGRATFIPLEKQQRFLKQCNQKIQTPEDVPRLFDLIKVEDKNVLPAFYYGLQDTLVVDNLDQATRIAYGAKRYRVVTLSGELIEMSGTMSGGGRTVSRGRMGQSIIRAEPNAADVETLQVNLDAIYEKCNRLRVEQVPLEDQVRTLTNALSEMKLEAQKCTTEEKALREQLLLLKKQLVVQKKKVSESANDPTKLETLTDVVATAEKGLNDKEEISKSIEDRVMKINRQMDEISGGRVKEQRKVITALTTTLDKTKAEICKLQVEIKTAERNSRKTEQRIESLEDDVHNCEERIRQIQKEKGTLEEEAKVVLGELSEINAALVDKEESEATLKEALEKMQTRERDMKAFKIDLDRRVQDIRGIVENLRHTFSDYSKRIGTLKLKLVPGQICEPFPEMTEEEVKALNSKTIAAALQSAKESLPEQVPNMQLIQEYQEMDALYLKRAAEFEDITKQRNEFRDTYELARRRRAEEFISGFGLITCKLKEMYRMITLGGDAELELVDSLDAFSEGIVFSVRPPKKSWKNISNLSGGEKTLSSLALVFALHHYKPTPLYFMDEIDAALDFKNVSIVSNYIKERAKNAQFIVISLRSNMFEMANYLVGIYKTFNCTKCATIDLYKFQACTTNNNNTQKGGSSASQVLNPQEISTSPVVQTHPLGSTESENQEDFSNAVNKNDLQKSELASQVVDPDEPPRKKLMLQN